MAASFRFTPIAAALACLSGLSAPALAQTAQQHPATLPEVRVQDSAERADGPVEGYRAERSSTFTKTDTPLKEVPASITVVPSQLMKDQAMRSLGDAIRYVPGALQHQGEGNRDDFILRGIESSANLFVDGVRDDAQVFRDLYNLERVEVLKGAGGMIFGRGSAGGVVNRVTKKPVFGDVGEASVTVGGYNQLRASIDVGRKLNDSAAWRLNAVTDGSDSFRNGADMRRYAVNPTLTFVPGGQTSVTFGFDALRDERTADRGFPAQNGRPVNAAPGTFFGNAAQSNANSTVNGFYAILDHDWGGVQLKNTFRVTHYDKFYQNVYADNANASSVAGGTLRLAAYNNQNQRTNTFNQTDLTTHINAGGLEHTLLAGLELGRQDSDNKRFTGFFGPLATNNLATVSAGAPFATATRFQQSGTDANNNVKADIAAVYLQDQIALSKEWKLLAGLRYDQFKVDFDDRRTTTPAIDFSSTNNAFSPRAGLIWSPHASASYYASCSYAFLPSAENLAPTAVNASLDPESAKNYEVGARWDLRPGLTLSSALFRLDRDNVKNSDGAGGFVLTGRQRTQGVEIGLQGDVMRNWQVYAGYAHLDSRITKATTFAGNLGNRPQLVPENTLSVWNRVNVGAGWGSGLGVVAQGSSFANADNVVKLPGFTRADGAVYYAFANGKTRLALNVENLLDKAYFPTADGNNNISPGAPRTARLTLSTKF
jgi:catecholate siderophore receptor